MMHGHIGDAENLRERNLTRRKWLALLALSLATACVVVFGVEFVARQMYYESETTTLPCLVVNDPTTGVRGVPNSICSQKIFETRLTQYALNNCGHRAGTECRPKPVDVQRIVLVGSSAAYGMWVPQERSFAALLPVELSRRTGRKIELYNESMQWGTPHSVDLRFKEVLAAKPNVVLWALTPFDIENAGLTLPYVPVAKEAVGGTTIWHRAAVAFSKKPISDVIHDGWSRFIEALDQTRTVFLLQHLLYQSPSLYVKHFLMQGESAAFLRTEPDAAWKSQLMQLDTYAADLERQTKSIGATLVVTLLPQRAQAAMISGGEWPAGFDPYKVGEDVRSIIEHNGGTYIDVLHGLQNIPNAASYYFPVDGHLDVNGHKLLSDLLANALVSKNALPLGTIPDERATVVTGNE